ncbi:MAG TPA: hypothetical protein VNF47_19815 [Streptosporangiaceae bacterium]|nr:hypothetical protein [Streptosporangiaceae bacterium]
MIDFAVERSGRPCPAAERQRLLADPGFGRVLTDHMITIDWSQQRGWRAACWRARAVCWRALRLRRQHDRGH